MLSAIFQHIYKTHLYWMLMLRVYSFRISVPLYVHVCWLICLFACLFVTYRWPHCRTLGAQIWNGGSVAMLSSNSRFFSDRRNNNNNLWMEGGQRPPPPSPNEINEQLKRHPLTFVLSSLLSTQEFTFSFLPNLSSCSHLLVFTCGRRPAGLLATLVVVVVVGGITFLKRVIIDPIKRRGRGGSHPILKS